MTAAGIAVHLFAISLRRRPPRPDVRVGRFLTMAGPIPAVLP
jgi:hypothetical protein